MGKALRILFLLTGIFLLRTGEVIGQTAPYPVACYNFDGSLANDDPSAGINDLTVEGSLGDYYAGDDICFGKDSIYVTPGPGNGLHLDYQSEIPSDTYSLELLFKFEGPSTNTTTGRRAIINFKASNDRGLYLSDDGRLILDLGNGKEFYGTTHIPEGSWINISLTRDDVTGEIYVYYDGNLEITASTSDDKSGFTTLNNNFNFLLDGSANPSNENAQGALDYVRIYDQALDATVIDSLARVSKGDDIVITASDTDVCIGDIVSLSATGGRSYYIWSTGDTTLNEYIDITIMQDSTWVWVTGVAESPCNRQCYNITDSVLIIGHQPPPTDVIAPSEVCEQDTVTLSYAGAPSDIATYSWNSTGTFSAVGGSSSNNYSLVYQDSGMVQVTLQLVGKNGCPSDTTFSIHVNNVPTTTYTAPATICSYDEAHIVYTGDASSTATFTWNLNGGTITTVNQTDRDFFVTWPSSGTKNLSFGILEDGCYASNAFSITINPEPTTVLSAPDSICQDGVASVVYSGNASSTASFTWDWDGGTNSGTDRNAAVTWTSPGAKNVSLHIDDKGCVHDTAFVIYVKEIPTTTIAAPSVICQADTVAVTYTGSAKPDAIFVWNFNDADIIQEPTPNKDFRVHWQTPGTKTIELSIVQNGCQVDTVITVQVDNTPTADFTIPAGACTGNTIRALYTGTANMNSATFNWSWGAGATATKVSPAQEAYDVSWSTAGTKTVTLSVTEGGCTSPVFTQTVNVTQTPAISYNYSNVICLNDSTFFDFTGLAGASPTFTWDFDGGDTTQVNGGEQFYVKWASAGNKTLTLNIDNGGCTSSQTFPVTVQDIPTTDVTADSSVCQYATTRIIYTGTADLNNDTFTWDFASGNATKLGNQQAYDVDWSTSGKKKVKLTIGVANGCQVADSFYITVNPLEVPTATVPASVCQGDAATVTYTGTPIAGTSYSWVWDGGAATATGNFEEYNVTWSTPGIKTISLTTSNTGCDSTITYSVNVASPPTTDMTYPSQICENQPARFTYTGSNSPPPDDITWTIQDGTYTQVSGDNLNIDITFSSSGTKTIDASILRGTCTVDTSFTVSVQPTPDATFSTGAACSGVNTVLSLTAAYDATNTYTWDFDGGTLISDDGAGNWTVNWTTAGTKNVSLTIDNPAGCSDTYSTSITVGTTPPVDLNVPSDICQNVPTTFTYAGTYSDISTFNWHGWDGANSVVDNGDGTWDVQWNTAGFKNITLDVVGTNGCVNDTTFTIPVNNFPAFDFFPGASTACTGIPVIVSFSGTFDSSADTTWNWDGGIATYDATNQQYSVVWNTTGTKNVTLNIVGGCGNASVTKSITLNPGPVAAITASPDGCVGDPINVKFTGTDPSGVGSYTWSFDGGAAATVTPNTEFNVVWTTGGTKQVVVTLDDGSCAVVSDTAYINVYNQAAITINPASACIGDSIQVAFSGVVESGATFSWDFGAGSGYREIVTDSLFNVAWSTSGVKDVTLEVAGSCGTDQDTIQVPVGKAPDLAAYTAPTKGCTGEQLFFAYDTTTLDLTSPLSTADWYYVDAPDASDSTALGQESATWNTPGTKSLYLILNNAGCKDTLPLTVDVYLQPTSHFVANAEACAGETVNYTFDGVANSSTNFTWDFDTGTATTVTADSVYDVSWSAPGTYTVQLTVQNGGCQDVYQQDIVVHDIPSNDVSMPSQICQFKTATIQYTGNAKLSNSTFTWDFGKGSATALGNETYAVVWDTVGTDQVQLTIVDSLGCTNDTTVAVNIVQSPTALFAFSSEICQIDTVQVDYIGTSNGLANITYNDVDGGTITSSINGGRNTSIHWDSAGVKTLQLTLSDANACPRDTTLQVTVRPTPDMQMTAPVDVCVGDTAIVAYSGAADIYSDTFVWDFSGTTGVQQKALSGQEAYQLVFKQSGPQNISLSVSNAYCTHDTTLTVNVKPAPDMTVVKDVQGCVGDAINFYYTGTDTYLSENLDGGVRSGNTVIWSTAGDKTITYSVGNGTCTKDSTFTLHIYPNPAGSITISGDHCANSVLTVGYSGGSDLYATYNWDFDTASTVTKIAGTESYNVQWNSGGTHTISLNLTEDGCTTTFTKDVTLYAIPPGDFKFKASACEHEAVDLEIQNYDPAYTYSWQLDGGVQVGTLSGGQQGIMAVWDTAGSKSITLTVDNQGCPLVKTHAILIKNAPDASFDAPDVICLNSTGTITYTGDADLTKDSFSWDFGSGSTASQIAGTQNYNVSYSTPGYKVVSLTVTNSFCGSDTFTDTISVNNKADFEFTSVNDSLCEGAQATFLFTGTAEPNAQIIWDFDTTGNDQVTPVNPPFSYDVVYNDTGPRVIRLLVKGVTCSDDSLQKSFTVADNPTSDFTVNSTYNCLGDSIEVKYIGTSSNGRTLKWDWDGAGVTAINDSTFHIAFDTAGTKNISLKVTDGGCNSSTTQKQIKVYDNNDFDLIINDQNLCLDSATHISFSGFLEPTATYNWGFDGATILGSNADSTEIDLKWTTPGAKSVKINITGDLCPGASGSMTVNVGERVPFDILADKDICLNDSSRIVYTGSLPPGRVFTWDFDSASVVRKMGSKQDYYVQWDNPGNKIVHVTLNNSGCIRDSSFTVAVRPIPDASFTIPSICQEDTLTLVPDWPVTGATSIEWDYTYNGQSYTSTSSTLSVPLPYVDTMQVTLSVRENGCQSTQTQMVPIGLKPSASIDAPDIICREDYATITFDTTQLSGASYSWDFDNPDDVDSVGNEVYMVQWADGGIKQVSVQVSYNGCTSDVFTEPISILGADGLQQSSDTICQHETVTVQFDSSGVSGLNYTWDFDNGQILSGGGFGPYEIQWSTTGDKTIHLSIQDFNCASDSLVSFVHVNRSVMPTISIGLGSVLCQDDQVDPNLQLSNEGDDPVIEWFVNGALQGTDIVDVSLNDGDTLQARLTSSVKCAVSNQVWSNKAVANVSSFNYTGSTNGETPICLGDTTSITLSQSGNYNIVSWQYSTDGKNWTATSQTSSVYTDSPQEDTYYRAQVEDLYGICQQFTPPVLVKVLPYHPIDAGDDQMMRLGDYRILKAIDGQDFTWLTTTGMLTNPSQAEVKVSPKETTTYYVRGLTKDGCPDVDSVTVIVKPVLEIPNVITPNGDGSNDTWVIDQIKAYPSAEVHIYDRWGKRIFTSIGYNDPWDGKFNGKLLAPGVYYYVIDLKDGYPPYKGSVTILR